MNSFHRGFTIIESICMLGAIVVFALICAAIYKKQPDFFGMNHERWQATAQVVHARGSITTSL